MTPASIRTGRALSTRTYSVNVPDAAPLQIAQGHADRVALSVSMSAFGFTSEEEGVQIGPLVDGELCPLTVLLPGHPVCYLSVDKLGNAIFQAIYAATFTGDFVILGVTDVRLTQPLEGT